MKYLLTAMFLLVASFATAQIVNIPDASFKAALIAAGVDTNNDNNIQVSEAEAITVLNLRVPPDIIMINDFTGIKSFTNMKIFTINANFNVSGILDVSGLIKLEKLEVPYTRISIFNVAGCTGLKMLFIPSNNSLSFLDVSSCTGLEQLDCNGSILLQNITLGNLSKLTSLNLNDCPHFSGALDLTHCDSLTNLLVSNIGADSSVEVLNISGLNKIQEIQEFRSIKKLIARNCAGLKIVSSYVFPDSRVTNLLDLTNCVNLEKVHIELVYATNPIDLSGSPNLKTLFFHNVEAPSINLKNGSKRPKAGSKKNAPNF